ncbi:hypothetical protein TorRG33x02_257910, partial [Trema orientale]
MATSASSSTRTEAETTAAGGTVNLTASSPAAAAEAVGACPVAAAEPAASAVGPGCSTEARPKGPAARIPRPVSDWNQRRTLSSGGNACRRRPGTRRRRGRPEAAAKATTALA